MTDSCNFVCIETKCFCLSSRAIYVDAYDRMTMDEEVLYDGYRLTFRKMETLITGKYAETKLKDKNTYL